MPALSSVKHLLNPATLIQRWNKQQPIHTPIMDLVYPERKKHPFSVISYEDLPDPVKNIPLVARGASSYSLGEGPNQISFIEPQNITPSKRIPAQKLNDLGNLSKAEQAAYINDKVDEMKKTIHISTEALCAQSLTGTISYDLKTVNGGFEKYTVNFGTPQTFTPDKKWSDAACKEQMIIADIGKMCAKIQEKYPLASHFLGFISRDVYSQIAVVAGKTTGKSMVTINRDAVFIGDVELHVVSEKYYDYTRKQSVPVIDDKKIKIVAVDAGFSLWYCTLDELDEAARKQAIGFREVIENDPQAIKIIGQSRPIPLPNTDAICDATVLA